MTTPPYQGGGTIGYPVHQVIDGNLDVVDPYSTGQYGIITCRELIATDTGPDNTLTYLQSSGDASGATDYANLQAAINNLPSGGGTIYVEGQFVIGSTALNPVPGMRITSTGYNSSSIVSSTGSIFNMDQVTTQLDNIEIDHIALQVNGAFPIFSGMFISRSSVHHCRLTANNAGAAIWFSNSGTGYMVECRFYENREETFGTPRTVHGWDISSTNAVTLFQVNDCTWHDNVVFHNNLSTAKYHYHVAFNSTAFPTFTSNALTFRDTVFEFPQGGMIWLESASYATIERITCEDMSTHPVTSNGLIKISQSANGGGSYSNKIISYSRRVGSESNTLDIQLDSNCQQSTILAPAQAGGGQGLTIDLGDSATVNLIAVPSTATVINTSGVLTPTAQSAPAGFTPTTPAGTTSTTLVMAGLGATCAYTPSNSGQVLVNVTGYILSATAVATVGIGCRYGTGTAPSAGVAVTGTRFGSLGDVSFKPASASASSGFAFTALITGLTPSTAYWFDLCLDSNGTDAATLADVSMTMAELPA